MGKPVLEIDGDRFDDLRGFYAEVSRVVIPGAGWGCNLDAFNDILRGGFGTPDGGFVLRWKNSARSRRQLGYPETLRWLQHKVQHCDPTNVNHVQQEIKEAERTEGPTLFDILIEIIRVHGEGGGEAEDGVELELA